MAEKKTKKKQIAKVSLAKPVKKLEKTKENSETLCSDKDCFIHGKLRARGRIFEGKVTRKFPRRVAIEFERMVYVRKYERYAKSKTKIHARVPNCMENNINLGDIIRVQECRPLSKIIHFVVIKKIKSAEEIPQKSGGEKKNG